MPVRDPHFKKENRIREQLEKTNVFLHTKTGQYKFVKDILPVMNILTYVQLRNIYESTGAGRVARQITEHLAREPVNNIRILADPTDHKKVIHKAGMPWTRFDYHFFRHETSKQQARWIFAGMPTAEHYWPEVEIVYCTNVSYVPTRRARLVITVHDAAVFEDEAVPRKWTSYKQRFKSRYLYNMLSRKADIVHTGSHFSAERIAHYFPDLRSRLRVVHYAVTPRFFLPVSAEGEGYLEQQELRDRPFILLPCGLHYRKNAALVLKAWPLIHQLHPDLKLVVASHCDSHYADIARGLGESVKMTGFVSDEILCSLHHAAQLVWFPSFYEGFGLPLLEAMACGTPVIASNTTSIPEVADNSAMLVSPKSVTEHVEAIDTLLQNDSQREELSHRGKVRAQQFKWSDTVARLKRLFLSLV